MSDNGFIGSIIGDTYTILEQLGAGGMGSVFKASDPDGEIVAVKMLDPELAHDEEFIKRFLLEINTLAELKHPNIAQYFNADIDEGRFYYTMEYVDGCSLMDLIEDGHVFSDEEIAHIGIEVADVLDYAQKIKLVHRDIKPENILIDHDTNEVKVLDLGLARYTHAALDKVTKGVKAIGTVDYMSPEQAQGLDDIDIRSDIYGLGATLFLLATGDIPCRGKNDIEKMRRIVEEPAPRPQDIHPDVSKELDYIISKMMCHDRKNRYQYPAVVLNDLTAFSEGKFMIRQKPVSRVKKTSHHHTGARSPRSVMEIVIIGWIVLLVIMILYIFLLLLTK